MTFDKVEYLSFAINLPIIKNAKDRWS